MERIFDPNPLAQADNWEIASCCAAGGGAGVTVGGWMFQFRNYTLNARATYFFGGAGVGIGAKAGGTGDLDGYVEDSDFSSIDTEGAMSFDDLDGAGGWINSAGLAAGIGGGVCFVSAAGTSRTYFGMCPVYGMSMGVEASINFITFGKWKLVSQIKPYTVRVFKPPSPMRFRVARESISIGPRGSVVREYTSPVLRPGESVMTPGL